MGCQKPKKLFKKSNKMEAFPFSSNYLEREFYTRHVGIPVLLWTHIRAKGSVGMLPLEN